jgi:hypothetical protein
MEMKMSQLEIYDLLPRRGILPFLSNQTFPASSLPHKKVPGGPACKAHTMPRDGSAVSSEGGAELKDVPEGRRWRA